MGDFVTKEGLNLVGGYVGRKVASLQNGFFSGNSSFAASQLARLRRSVGKSPGVNPDIWPIEFDGMPSELAGKGDVASPGEWATHIALTLYAVHQQSQTKPMHVSCDYANGVFHGIGNAVRLLAISSEGESLEQEEMPRRLSAMVTAETLHEVAHYARQLVQQLRAQSIPMDYARLARQLYAYQSPYRRDGVRLQWAREFSASPRQQQDADNS